MIGKIQDYKLKDVKVKENEATVTFTSRSVSVHGAEAAFHSLLMSLCNLFFKDIRFGPCFVIFSV